MSASEIAKLKRKLLEAEAAGDGLANEAIGLLKGLLSELSIEFDESKIVRDDDAFGEGSIVEYPLTNGYSITVLVDEEEAGGKLPKWTLVSEDGDTAWLGDISTKKSVRAIKQVISRNG